MARRKKADVNTSAFIGMVNRYLAEKNLTPAEFARVAKVEHPALSRLLSDEHRRPEPEMVVSIADAIKQPVWAVAVAAGYPFKSPGMPSMEDERLMLLIQADPEIRTVIERYYQETSPEVRESLLLLATAILNHRRPERDQSSG